MTKRHYAKIAIISALIMAVTMALDYFVNVVLTPGATYYSPLSTFAIVVLVAPSFTYTLVRQSVKTERALAALADEHAARLAADAASAAKTRFLANMSHELRTPLNAIIGYSEMIEEESDAHGHAANTEDARRVQRSAHHLLALIEDVLDHAQIESGKLKLEPAITALAPLLAEIAAEVGDAATANDNRLIIEADPELGSAYLDRKRLKQCMSNLAGNAVKFTHGGVVAIKLTVDGVSKLRFEVRDTGIGIAKDAQARLFQPFQQEHHAQAQTRLYGGTGLGLAITKNIVDAMGGTIEVHSAPGVGSTFAIIVPRVQDNAQQEAA
jgi:signal transduction histidine kinase